MNFFYNFLLYIDKKIFKSPVKWIFWIVLSGFVIALISRIILITQYNPDLGGCESNFIYCIQRIIAGYPLYSNPGMPPYLITNFTPLYLEIASVTSRLLGIAAENVHGVYVISRSLSLLFNLLYILIFTFFLIRIFKIKPLIAIIFSVLPFIHLNQHSFSRPDSLELLLCMTSFFLAYRYILSKESGRKYKYLYFSLLFAVLAVFTKQSSIYVLFLILAYLFISFDWRALIIGTAGSIIAIAIGIWIIAGGDFKDLYLNTILGNANGIDFRFFTREIVENYLLRDTLINILGLGLGFLFLMNPKNESERFMGFLSIGAFFISLLASLKYGAGPNYFKVFLGLTIVQFAYFSTKRINIFDNLGSSQYKYLIMLIFVYLTIFKTFRLADWITESPEADKIAYFQQKEIYNFIENLPDKIKNNEYIFISTHLEDFLNKFFYKNVLSPNKELVVQCYPYKVFDYSYFKKNANSGLIKYIIGPKQDMNSYFLGVHQEYFKDNDSISVNYLGIPLNNFRVEKVFDNYILLKYTP